MLTICIKKRKEKKNSKEYAIYFKYKNDTWFNLQKKTAVNLNKKKVWIYFNIKEN